jgi:hypothetical protein
MGHRGLPFSRTFYFGEEYLDATTAIVLGVFIDLLAAPFCYEGSTALMAKQYGKAAVGYGIGIPLALIGLAVAGVFGARHGTSTAEWIYPVASDPRWWIAVLFLALLWLGGPHFIERMRFALTDRPSTSGIKTAIATTTANEPHVVIDFNYVPAASPLENGWTTPYFDKRIRDDPDPAARANYLKSRQWKVAPGAPIKGSIMIDIDASAIDYQVSPNAALSQRIEFDANYVDRSAMIFVHVLLATRDDRQTKTKFIKFIPGSKKPYKTLGYEDSEYTVEMNDNDAPSLGKGWRKISLSLPVEIERSWGQDGWYYKELRAIRLRGRLGISPIRLYG